MTVWCPQYIISRNENNYTRANDFVPERWSSKPDMVKDAAGYAPFSAGKYYIRGQVHGTSPGEHTAD